MAVPSILVFAVMTQLILIGNLMLTVIELPKTDPKFNDTDIAELRPHYRSHPRPRRSVEDSSRNFIMQRVYLEAPPDMVDHPLPESITPPIQSPIRVSKRVGLNSSKFVKNQSSDLVDIDSYEGIQKLLNWFNRWKNNLGLTKEQISQLKIKLQELEKRYKNDLNSDSKLEDTVKCLPESNANCTSKPSTMVKPIVNQTESVPVSLDENYQEDNGIDKYDDPEPLSRQEPFDLLLRSGALVIIAPVLIANLALILTSTGLAISNRASSVRLSEIHQEQLNALSAIAGMPIELVNPVDSDVPAATTDGGTGNPSRIGKLKNQAKVQSTGVISRAWEETEDLLKGLEARSTFERNSFLLGLLVFWISVSIVLTVIGYTELGLALLFITVPVGLYIGNSGRFDTFYRSNRRSGKRSLSSVSGRDLDLIVLNLAKAALKFGSKSKDKQV